MEVIAKGKFIRVSPTKARQIADLIRGQKATVGFDMVRSMPHAGAKVIAKVLKSAMANAETNFSLDKEGLVISKIMIDGGPVIKRWQPRARGAAYEIRKRTSHVTIVVAGEMKTKKTAEAPKKAEKVQEDEHKMEVERPDFMKKDQVAPNAGVKNKIFRRKTG